MYKSSGQKQKYILPWLTLTLVSLKSMCCHTATYQSFLSFCDRDGRQRRIPSGPFCQIEWREYKRLFLEGLPCGTRVRPFIGTVHRCHLQVTIWEVALLESPLNMNSQMAKILTTRVYCARTVPSDTLYTSPHFLGKKTREPKTTHTEKKIKINHEARYRLKRTPKTH